MKSVKKQRGVHYKALALALVVFANTDGAMSNEACHEILGAPTAATTTAWETLHAERGEKLSFEVSWGTLSDTVDCTYLVSDATLLIDRLEFAPEDYNICIGNSITIEALGTAFTTNLDFRRSVERRLRRRTRVFLDSEEILRNCPNRPELCPVEEDPTIAITSVVANEGENLVEINASATWSNRNGTTTCEFKVENATLTATSLIFEALTSQHCLDNIGTGIGDALASHYNEDAIFRSDVATRLTNAGEVLRKDEEISRLCPNHPTLCDPNSVSITSVSKNFSLFSVDLVAAVEWRGSTGLTVTGTATCNFLLREAELTPTALVFGAPTSAICREDVVGTTAALIKHYEEDATFSASLDAQLTNTAEMWRREVERMRSCPNHPTWCPSESVSITSVTPNNSTQVVVLNVTVVWRGSTGLTEVGTTSCNFPAAEATLTASALVFGAPSSSNCSETLAGTRAALVSHYRRDAAFRANVNSRLSTAAEPWRRQIEIDAGCPNHPSWCPRPPPRPPSTPPPRQEVGCMPGGGWPTPPAVCP